MHNTFLAKGCQHQDKNSITYSFHSKQSFGTTSSVLLLTNSRPLYISLAVPVCIILQNRRTENPSQKKKNYDHKIYKYNWQAGVQAPATQYSPQNVSKNVLHYKSIWLHNKSAYHSNNSNPPHQPPRILETPSAPFYLLVLTFRHSYSCKLSPLLYIKMFIAEKDVPIICCSHQGVRHD